MCLEESSDGDADRGEGHSGTFYDSQKLQLVISVTIVHNDSMVISLLIITGLLSLAILTRRKLNDPEILDRFWVQILIQLPFYGAVFLPAQLLFPSFLKAWQGDARDYALMRSCG